MNLRDIVTYITNTSNVNWKILEGLIFSWKEKESEDVEGRLAGLLYLNKIKEYINNNDIKNINPSVFQQLLLEVEEVIEI